MSNTESWRCRCKELVVEQHDTISHTFEAESDVANAIDRLAITANTLRSELDTAQRAYHQYAAESAHWELMWCEKRERCHELRERLRRAESGQVSRDGLVTVNGIDSLTDEELEAYGLMRLPHDMDGVPIRLGDVVSWGKTEGMVTSMTFDECLERDWCVYLEDVGSVPALVLTHVRRPEPNDGCDWCRDIHLKGNPGEIAYCPFCGRKLKEAK